MVKPIMMKAKGWMNIFAMMTLFITAACSDQVTNQVAEQVKETSTPISSEASRSALIFDPKKHSDLFTVRYFSLKGETPTGDAIFIRTPDGKTMLIDAGIPEVGGQVVDYLNRLGIDTIDVAVNTHPHHDHLGGFAKVIAQKNVKQFYMINLSLADYGSDSYRSAVAQFNIKKVSRGILEEGMTFSLGKEVSVEVFSPDKGMSVKDLKSYSDADINFHSTVFKVTYKGTSFLFAGDIYQDREKMLVDKYGSKLQADMMHAPHHGSSSSSSDAYIRAVKPKIAVFSFHRINSDGFQNWLRYEKQGAKVYHTGVNGNILITSDGKQLNVLTEKDYNFR